MHEPGLLPSPATRNVDELQQRAAALAKTGLDKFGPTWEVTLEKERVAMQAAGVRAGTDAVQMGEEQRTVLVKAMLARLRVVGRPIDEL
jgi:hypothetical protein